MKKTCETCNSIYTKGVFVCKKQWAKSRFCSSKCRSVWMKSLVPVNKKPDLFKICEVCQKKFRIKHHRKETARFCSRKCQGKTRVGENGINWQGGLTPKHTKIRNSDEYKLWRAAVFERDDFTCIQCGQRGGKLEADHIKLFSKFPELRLDVSNGQTLCKSCHRLKTINDLKLNWKNQYTTITALN